MKRKILLNAIVCNKCSDFIFSRHRHDYIICSCGDCAVDGGVDYLKRSGGDYSDKSVLDDGLHETRVKALYWGSFYDKNGKFLLKPVYRPISKLDTEHIYNILTSQPHINTLYKQVFEDEIIYREQQLTKELGLQYGK